MILKVENIEGALAVEFDAPSNEDTILILETLLLLLAKPKNKIVAASKTFIFQFFEAAIMIFFVCFVFAYFLHEIWSVLEKI